MLRKILMTLAILVGIAAILGLIEYFFKPIQDNVS